MKLPRRKFLHLAAGAAALPAVSRFARAQTYPARPVRIIVLIAPGGALDIARSPDGSMAVGAPRPALRHREPAGRRQQHRHRGGVRCARRRLYDPPASASESRSTRRFTTSSITIFPRHVPVAGVYRVPTSWWCPSVRPRRSRVHRLCQGQSGKVNMASVGIGSRHPIRKTAAGVRAKSGREEKVRNDWMAIAICSRTSSIDECY